MKKILNSQSLEETEKLGENIASALPKGGVIALYGDLGSGKTTFVRGLGKAFGIEDKIASPSFILQREYLLDQKKYSIKKIYHLDLYRLSENDKVSFGIEDLIKEDNSLVIIEWADRFKNYLPNNRTDIYFNYISENERKITIEEVEQ